MRSRAPRMHPELSRALPRRTLGVFSVTATAAIDHDRLITRQILGPVAQSIEPIASPHRSQTHGTWNVGAFVANCIPDANERRSTILFAANSQ
jgi:hypothetical protein